ncbi:hypothetical protein NT6N_27400 [Oceaniferula spumae]|uniref:Redoxin domain-containing protein n=1 Tax=Oceaniferula spumae TaxID=2979115 RepID=A0AAT9FP22_9BACT
MKTKLLFTVVAASFVGVAAADPNPPEATAAADTSSPATSAEAINKDIQEYEALYAAFMKKVRAEKDRQKAMKLYQEVPKIEPYMERVLGHVEKNPTNASSKKALMWSLTYVRQQPLRSRIGKIFTTHFINDPLINEYAKSLSRSISPQSQAELRDIIEKSSNPDTKIYATYYLANNLSQSVRRFPNLSDEEKAAKTAESNRLLKQLSENPEVAKLNEKLAKRIASVLFEQENLGIGCTAPDIVGDDHTGTVFKLSDYRGKVVLLDFWGIW